jgi:broad specificity phosphatase PhoE
MAPNQENVTMMSIDLLPAPPMTASAVVTPLRGSVSVERKKTIYLVRHAEAEHNILEKEAVARAIASGALDKCQQEEVRKSVLRNPSLQDSPLSSSGKLQAQKSYQHLQELLRKSSQEYKSSHKFLPPQIVLVSPLRRSLMTATEQFYNLEPRPRFVALEILREKRTGLACDERSPVAALEREFPHVDFSNLSVSSSPDPGEDNELLRKRTRRFLDEVLVNVEDNYVAIVSHKGWLRELRHTLKSSVDSNQLQVDFDIKEWEETLYKNAEIRVAEFGWNRDGELVSIVSRSVDNAISSIVANS